MTRRPLPVLGLALGVALLACTGPSLAEVAVGDPAPEFALTDLDGGTVDLASLRGKTVVLEWINPNCPFSRAHSEAKTMQKTADAHGEVVWLAINSTNPKHGDHLTPAEHKAFMAQNGASYPVLEDPAGTVGRSYGAKTTPHMFVIDPEGKIAYMGAIDDGPRNARTNYVDAALTAMASGQSPDPASTRPYGCSVKY
jgi:peroxiredoxin